MMASTPVTVNRTTTALYLAMFDLLERVPFEQITVHDICEKAMVSRTTFYAYFEDKYHLVAFCLQRERASLALVPGEQIKDNILAILHRFRKKAEVYKNILLAQTNRELNRMLIDQMQGIIYQNLTHANHPQDKAEVLSILYATGYAGSMLWWLEEQFPLPEERLAEYLYSSIDSQLLSSADVSTPAESFGAVEPLL